MYSYEDRLRAVKLYLTLGKRCKATIRQLGYPTKNALGFYPDYTDGFKKLVYFKSCCATLRRILGLWNLSI